MSFWKRTMQALGLVDEYESEEEAPFQSPNQGSVRPSGPSRAPQRPPGSNPAQHPPPGAVRPRSEQGRPSGPPLAYKNPSPGVVVRPGGYPESTSTRAEIIEAQEINDAKRIADLIRERTPVIVNLKDAEPDMARRIVDFCSGLTYALDGKISKTARGVILVSPPRVELSSREVRRLSSMGLYDQDS